MTEVIYGVCPSKSNQYKIGRNGMYKSKALSDYEKKFFIQCRNRNKLITGYFEVGVKVFYPTERADLDNALKVVMDCLQTAKVIVNDNKCVKIVAEKYLDKANPRIELNINELNLC
jgi:Holliday junction resolvase RusA-like endonuclease